MGVLNFMLKSTIKKNIKRFLVMSNMDNSKINILLNDLSEFKYHVHTLANENSNGLPIQQRLEHSMVIIAELYMEHLLTIDSGGIVSEKDFTKLHYCLAVMTAIISDQWLSIDCKLIRLDLWEKHWKQINEVGSFIIKQPAKKSPIVVTLYIMITTNYESGVLFLPDNFPSDLINEMILEEYSS